MADVHFNIDDELKHEAQLKALKQKTNLTAVIIKLLKKWLHEPRVKD